jgi:16S rRNA (guanine966-N2)-methyltransferase
MGDKIRGALFNILGDIEGLTVLDAFAGSGALSLEAISRGAVHATAIESDQQAQTAIAKNIISLGVDSNIKLIRATADAWLQTSDQHFDIVLLDPPYSDRQESLLAKLAGRVNPDGVVVVSWPGGVEPLEFQGFTCVVHREYGDAQLLFYKQS